MGPAKGALPGRAADRALAGLLALWVLATLWSLVALPFSGLLPAGWVRACAMFLETLPPAARVAFAVWAGLGLGGSALGAGTLAAELLRTRRAVGRLLGRRAEAPPHLRRLGDELGLADRLELVDEPEPYAFSHGVRRPRVVVSRGLVDVLDPAELRAVLLHERGHVIRRSGLRLALARALARALCYLPLAADLACRCAVLEELAADRYALERLEDRWTLAAALVKVVRARRRAPILALALAPAAGSGAGGGLALRAQQILSYPQPVPVPLWGSVRAACLRLGVTLLVARAALAVAEPVVVAALAGTCPVLYL